MTQSPDQVLKENEFRDSQGRPHRRASFLRNHNSDWEVSRTWLENENNYVDKENLTNRSNLSDTMSYRGRRFKTCCKCFVVTFQNIITKGMEDRSNFKKNFASWPRECPSKSLWSSDRKFYLTAFCFKFSIDFCGHFWRAPKIRNQRWNDPKWFVILAEEKFLVFYRALSWSGRCRRFLTRRPFLNLVTSQTINIIKHR